MSYIHQGLRAATAIFAVRLASGYGERRKAREGGAHRLCTIAMHITISIIIYNARCKVFSQGLWMITGICHWPERARHLRQLDE